MEYLKIEEIAAKWGIGVRRAKIHFAEAPAKNDYDRDAMALAISAVDIMVYNVENFPEWFKKDSVGKQKVCNMRAKRN